MTHSDLYLLCFVFGFVWSVAALLFGSFHLHDHMHGPHVHHHGMHSPRDIGRAASDSHIWSEFLNVNSFAIFIAWFGGCGYLMSRHSGLGFAIVLLSSVLAGLVAAFLLAYFLRFLHRRERVLDPFDYDMVGVLGRVSSTIREGGTGEILFSRDGARQSACARSEEGQPIERGIEVIVTRYEKGVAYVRTWSAMTNYEAAYKEQDLRGSGEEAPPLSTWPPPPRDGGDSIEGFLTKER
jgi:membrane protein implicated in regulation of membrane protease activity